MVKNVNASGQYGSTQFTVSQTSGDGAYDTIQEAVTAASSVAGATVHIQQGVYTESVVWPPNISAIGAATGQEIYDVVIQGNQSFAGNGNLSFENLEFAPTSGDAFLQTTSSGISIVDFTRCKLNAVAGSAYISLSTGGNPALSNFLNSQCIGADTSIIALGDSVVELTSCLILNLTPAINGIELRDNSVLNISLSSITLAAGGGACIFLNGANASVDSSNNLYNAGNVAASNAFRFNVAGSEVQSIKDHLNVVSGTYWAASTGAFGTLTYSSNVISSGTTTLIDPQITNTALTVIPDVSFSWSIESSGTTLVANQGFISTSASPESFPLPTACNVGEIFELTQKGVGAITITQAAGQLIVFGNQQTTTGATGSIVSTNPGDAIKLVCTVANLEFQVVTGSIGNWVIN